MIESIRRMKSVNDGDDYNNPSSCLVEGMRYKWIDNNYL